MNRERDVWSANGLLATSVVFLLLFLISINLLEREYLFVIIFLMLTIILLAGLTIVKRNEAKVVLLFGQYLGSLRQEGLLFTVPFTKRKRVSLKIKTLTNTFTVQKDERKITVKMVIFYKIVDTAKILFEVEDVESFISLQSEHIFALLEKNYALLEKLKSDEYDTELLNKFFAMLEEKLSQVGIEVVDVYLTTH